MSAGLLPAVEEMLAMARAMAAAREVPALVELAAAARRQVARLLDEGAGARQATRLLSLAHDHLTARVLTLLAPRFRLPPASWCWLSLGSEGRHEQTLATDQDNGLVFSASGSAEARDLRLHFLPFAESANAALAHCGIPLCLGKVMAGNPDWCLSAEEWGERFTGWVKTPEPEALLNAAIFFDLHGLHGDLELAATLRRRVTQLTRGNEAFLHRMGTNALAAAPQLGMVRDFAPEKGDEGKVDLKKFGARIFVDAARILALDTGVDAADTATRLRGAAAAGRLPPTEAEGALAALDDVQRLRLRGQIAALEEGRPVDSRIDPERLNDYDRRLLREALRQARHLQQRLKNTYHIEG